MDPFGTLVTSSDNDTWFDLGSTEDPLGIQKTDWHLDMTRDLAQPAAQNFVASPPKFTVAANVNPLEPRDQIPGSQRTSATRKPRRASEPMYGVRAAKFLALNPLWGHF